MGDKEGHYMIIKGLNYQEGITIINIYAPNIGAPKFIMNTNITKSINKQQCNKSWEL